MKTIASYIEVQASEAANVPEEIEILRPTTLKGLPNHPDITVTEADLDEYVANNKRGVRKGVYVDVEHGTDPKYGKRSFGWADSLFVKAGEDGIKSLWAKIDWTRSGTELVADKAFKFISPAFFPRGYVDPEGKFRGKINNVLKAITLTNAPLFKDLKPITASDNMLSFTQRLLEPIVYASEEESLMKLEDVRGLKPSELTDEHKTFLKDHKDELTDEERKTHFPEAKKEEKKEEVKKEEVKKEVQANDGVLISASELAALKSAAAEGVLANEKLRRTEATSFLNTHVKRGAIKADQVESAVGLILASEDGADGLKSFIEALPDNKLVTAGEIGSNEKGSTGLAAVSLEEKAQEIMANDKSGKLNFADALKVAARQTPNLVTDYENELEPAK